MPTIEELEAVYSGLPRNTIQDLAELHSGHDIDHGQDTEGQAVA